MAVPEEARDGGGGSDARGAGDQVDAHEPTRIQVRGELSEKRCAHEAEQERRLDEERHHHCVLPAQATGQRQWAMG